MGQSFFPFYFEASALGLEAHVFWLNGVHHRRVSQDAPPLTKKPEYSAGCKFHLSWCPKNFGALLIGILSKLRGIEDKKVGFFR